MKSFFYLNLSQEEAERWKERGNQLLSCKETKTLDLVIACYTLALKFTPEHEKDLRATILSNRCLMYIRRENAEEALKDARDCVDIKPDWPKVKLPFNLIFHKMSGLKVQPSPSRHCMGSGS